VNYYEIALLKSPLEPLTYQSIKDLQLGQKVLVSIRGRKNLSDGVIIKKVEQPSFKCTDIDTITELFYDEQMLEVAKFISLYYVCSLGEALGLYTPYTLTNEITLDKFESNIELSNTQQKAFDFCDKNNTSLLFANTGSGKTEIYIKMIEKYINQNKQSILLMPEISLTPQMENDLKKYLEKVLLFGIQRYKKRKKKRL
jgi:primosomal protein N' (replication factor Y)